MYNCSEKTPQKKQPLAKKGILDLRDWNFKTDGPAKLVGQWEFYWKQLLKPVPSATKSEKSNFQSSQPKIKRTGYLNLPSLWNNYQDDESYTGQGYATFKLKVFIKDPKPILGLRIGDMYSAYNLYINGELVAVNGLVGKNSKSMKSQWLPVMSFFNPGQDELSIVLQISNFHHKKGGTWIPVLLGTPEQLKDIRDYKLAIEQLLLGSLIIMAIYHFGLYLLHREDYSSLFFGLFCLMLSLRILETGERFLVHIFPELGFELHLKIEYLSLYLGLPLFNLFLYILYPNEVRKFTLIISVAFIGIMSAIVLLTPAIIYSYTPIAYQVFLFSIILWGTWALSLAIYRKRSGAQIVFFGCIALFGTAINDILYNNELIQTGDLAPLGLFIFIFAQSMILSRRFAQAHRAATTLSVKLEDNQKLTEANQAKLKRLHIDKLKHAIQPHYLLNSIHAISGWMSINPEKASEMVESLSQEYRSILELSDKATISMAEELKLCRNHLTVMSARKMKEYILTTKNVNEKTQVPPLLFHTLVENGIQHEKSGKTAASFQLEQITEINRTVYIFSSIGDFSTKKTGTRKGTGIKYIEMRLEELFPGLWTFTQGPVAGGWQSIITIIK